MIYLYFAALLCWFSLFLWINKGLSRRKPDIPDESEEDKKVDVDVIIVFRNEEENLASCLEAFVKSYNALRFILVDDHSTDRSRTCIDTLQERHPELELLVLQNTGQGKKAALHTALDHVESSWIYFTDADCTPAPQTIGTMLHLAQETNRPVVFGPVLYEYHNLWTRLLAYENLNTQCLSEVFVQLGRPVMVNGGNMLMRATMKDRYKESLESDYTSGDDVFFAQSLMKEEMIGCYQLHARVHTSPPNSMSALFAQRLRWASKYPGYQHRVLRAFPAFIFGLNVIFLVMLVDWLSQGVFFHPLFVLLLAKAMIEYGFHRYWFLWYGFEVRIFDTLLLSLLFPIYYVSVGAMALVSPKFTWKGRTHGR